MGNSREFSADDRKRARSRLLNLRRGECLELSFSPRKDGYPDVLFPDDSTEPLTLVHQLLAEDTEIAEQLDQRKVDFACLEYPFSHDDRSDLPDDQSRLDRFHAQVLAEAEEHARTILRSLHQYGWPEAEHRDIFADASNVTRAIGAFRRTLLSIARMSGPSPTTDLLLVIAPDGDGEIWAPETDQCVDTLFREEAKLTGVDDDSLVEAVHRKVVAEFLQGRSILPGVRVDKRKTSLAREQHPGRRGVWVLRLL